MIDYELYEPDEVIKTRRVVKKKKAKKSDHKHEYVAEVRKSQWSLSTYFISVEVCKICGKNGAVKSVKN